MRNHPLGNCILHPCFAELRKDVLESESRGARELAEDTGVEHTSFFLALVAPGASLGRPYRWSQGGPLLKEVFAFVPIDKNWKARPK